MAGVLPEPRSGWSSPAAIDYYNGRLYVLDPGRDGFWRYGLTDGSGFDQNPSEYFTIDHPSLSDVIDFAVPKLPSKEIEPEDIPLDILYEDDDLLAFRDINPQAPTHVLLIPRKHIATLNDVAEDDAATIGRLFVAAREVAEREGFAEQGYRTVLNCNEAGGQTVFHVHLHLLGGRMMHWPPG